MKIAHFFDLDTILDIESMVWIIDKDTPNNPIMKISKSDFNLIKMCVFKSKNLPLYFNGVNYWIDEDLMNNLKVKCKRLKVDISNLGFSMQEFMNPEVIKDVDYEIKLDIFNGIKNTPDHIYLICSKNNKKNYELIIKKIEEKLHNIGLEIKDYYFISETFYNRNLDDITYKKVKILLQHAIGFKTDGNKFTEKEIENYDSVYYYDEDLKPTTFATTSNDILKILVDNTEDNLKSEIVNNLKDSDNYLFVNYVSPNKVNRIQTEKILLQISNVIKTFESFNWKKKN